MFKISETDQSLQVKECPSYLLCPLHFFLIEWKVSIKPASNLKAHYSIYKIF